jgi:hypothetical protein
MFKLGSPSDMAHRAVVKVEVEAIIERVERRILVPLRFSQWCSALVRVCDFVVPNLSDAMADEQ